MEIHIDSACIVVELSMVCLSDVSQLITPVYGFND